MKGQALQQYLIKQYPKEDEGSEWKEFKSLQNDFCFDFIQEKLEKNPYYFFKEMAFLRVFLSFQNQEKEVEEERMSLSHWIKNVFMENNIILYTTDSGSEEIQYEDGTFWLTQKRTTELFGVETHYHRIMNIRRGRRYGEVIVAKPAVGDGMVGIVGMRNGEITVLGYNESWDMGRRG